jgi:hypothetical protein
MKRGREKGKNVKKKKGEEMGKGERKREIRK